MNTQRPIQINSGGVQITPTRHEKLEWARLAQSAYNSDRNDVGHRFSGAASLRDAQSMPLLTFDMLQADYRRWLIDGVLP